MAPRTRSVNVYLYPSSEVESASFQNVLDLLNRNAGPIRFVQPESIPAALEENICYSMSIPELNSPEDYKEKNHRPALSWSKLFRELQDIRDTHYIEPTEPLFLLTDRNNDKNWFSFGNAKNDHYIHTAAWDYYLGSDLRYPVAYLVVSNLIMYWMYKDMDELLDNVHHQPKGCILDLCQDKKEISLKMRTADVCSDCMAVVNDKITTGEISSSAIAQLLAIMEDIRQQLVFKSRFELHEIPSRLQIHGHTRDIRFTDLGDLKLNLRPIEKAFYLFFLHHPEGVHLNELCEPHYKKEIKEHYSALGFGAPEDINRSIDDLTDPSSNSASEKISRIKREIIQAVGVEMADHYIIQGERGGPKSIKLDRGLLQVEELLPDH